jgi:hypothetical protein
LRAGLEALGNFPASKDRDELELQCLMAICPAYMSARCYDAAEVQVGYDRVRELCQALGDTPRAPVLTGMWTYHVVRAQHGRAYALAQEILKMGIALDDLWLQIQGYTALGWSHFFHGRLARARESLEGALELSDGERLARHSTFRDSLAVSAGGDLGQVLWLLGYPDAAVREREVNLARLRTLSGDPWNLAFGLDLTTIVRQYCGDATAARAFATEARMLSSERGFVFVGAMAAILLGWALAYEGQDTAGIGEMQQGFISLTDTGAQLATSYWLCLTAEACIRVGRVREAEADPGEG